MGRPTALAVRHHLLPDTAFEERRERRVPTFKDRATTYQRQAKQEQKQNRYWKTNWNLERATEHLGNSAVEESTLRRALQSEVVPVPKNTAE